MAGGFRGLIELCGVWLSRYVGVIPIAPDERLYDMSTEDRFFDRPVEDWFFDRPEEDRFFDEPEEV
jgi:hypothetical protein